MSLRSPKIGFVKNLNGVKNYCTKARPVDETPVIFGPPQRLANEIFPKKFPFPGSIGLSGATLVRTSFKPERKEKKEFKSLNQKTAPNGAFRQQITEIVENIENHMRIQAATEHESELPLKVEVFKADRAMELKAVPCPKTIKKDIGRLFVDVDFRKETDLTVLNLTQKSVADMSAWSEEMEAERNLLTKDFINVATAICHDLHKLNYWADFIEPSSGRPYLGGYTNATLVETDDRYRDLGFKIDDLGCCKIIKHAKWATHAFVGTIFTNAPIDSTEIKTILELSQTGHYFEEKPTLMAAENTSE